MTPLRRNLLLSTALLLVVLLTLALQPDEQRPNLEFLPDMVHQPRFAAFAANPYFTDGRTLRAPVPGTIPRGLPPLHYAASPEDAARAGRELANPIHADDAKAVARGKVLFSRFCSPCHGADGASRGRVVERGFPPPPSLHSARLAGMAGGQIFHILTYGQGNMPPYATQITREDRWRVILFLRSLQP